jgi:hypothetical protein
VIDRLVREERRGIMERREAIGMLGVGAIGAAAFHSAVQAQEREATAKRTGGQEQHGEHSAHFDECAKACTECQVVCQSCFSHCGTLVSKGETQHQSTMRYCVDCGDICAIAANISARRGPLAATICEACAQACEQCAKVCERFSNDEHMKRCAEECRQCAKACREMVQHVSGQHAN